MGRQMQNWSKGRSKELKRNRVELEDRLIHLYNQDPADEMLTKITEVQVELNLEADKEELFWEQRARKSRRRISELEDENGGQVTSSEEIINVASEYFKKLFSASNVGLDERLFSLVEKKGTDSMNDMLLRQFTEEDVAVNGEWFCPSRGLKQGDPLSPYLFLICAKGFSILIQDAKKRGWMTRATIGRERFAINHLFFADDYILFGNASCERARVVQDIIREYEMVSGQRVNFDKSLIYFGANVNSNVNAEIINLLGVRMATNLEKYLGLPMMVGRRKIWAFANFADRFRVLKARYFSFSDILSAKNWFLPFFYLEEYLQRPGLIAEGILWRVDTGDRINIWNDSWLPGRENNRVTVQQIRPNGTNINQLIDAESNTWNREMVQTLVNYETAYRIFSILISESCSEDMMV
ncbi:hypothetical protein PVK06_042127 [Gossypium arboreum]|uniref:Reverse transcriptase domain-containing protein n=1 Tax=Gossypium arboreum TaxID=29729 RepID=A0ABR0MLX4_GOSAR|nr:hypothetical protein PVK06_042127 [Gossypium arboreum]